MPRTGCCVIQLPVVVVRRRVVTNKRQGRSLQAGPTDFCRIQQAPNGFMLRNPLRKTLLIVFYTAWKANFRWKSILSIRYTMTSIFTRLRLSFINSQKLRCGYLIQHLSLPTRVFVPGQANNGHKWKQRTQCVRHFLTSGCRKCCSGRDRALLMAAWLPYRAGTGGHEGCSSSAFPFHARGDDYRVLKYWHLIQRQVPEQYWFWVLSSEWMRVPYTGRSGTLRKQNSSVIQ